MPTDRNREKRKRKMPKQFTKENSLTVKGTAILLLLNYHLFGEEFLVTSLKVNYSPFSLENFLMVAKFGNVCVSVFVFLTAFGIAKGLFTAGEISAREACRQAAGRFFRLMANFLVLYASVNLLWGYKFDYPSLYGTGVQGVLQAVTDGLGLAQVFGTPTLNMTWWYMEIAYTLIFLVPLLAWLTKKIGNYILLPAFFAVTMISFNFDIERYLLTAVLGVCAAYGNWPDKMLCLKCPKILQWLSGIAALVLCVLIRQNYVVQENYNYVADAPIVLVIVFVGGVLLASVPGLNKVLSFVGKHSMNIYLVHTFFYMILWQKFVYQFEYAGITLLLLLGVTLAYSVLLELLKKGVLEVIVKRICKLLKKNNSIDGEKKVH